MRSGALLLLWIFTWTINSLSSTPKTWKCGKCWCQNSTKFKHEGKIKWTPNVMTCRLSRNNSETKPLPKAPSSWSTSPYATHIRFDNSSMAILTNKMLSSYIRLKNLSLSFQNIGLQNITKDAFCNLQFLYSLNLSTNQIKQSVLKESFTCLSLNTSLKILNISALGLKNLSKDFFEAFKDLRKFRLYFHNNSREFQTEPFMKIKYLEVLDVGSNQMKNLNLSGAVFPYLRELILDNNELFHFPNFCFGNETSEGFPVLTTLFIQWNEMRYIDKETYSCLVSLTRLYLNGNLFQSLVSNQFAMLPRLYKITLSYVGCAMNVIQPAVFNNTNLKQIFFRENHIWFRKAEISLRIFEGCHNLELLNLNNNVFKRTTQEEFKQLLGQLKSLKVLVLGGCQLSFIPRVILEDLVNLESLALYDNEITELGYHTFYNLTKLRKLFMGLNKLTTIEKDSFPNQFIERAENIEFSSNDFSCTCNLVWFIDWLKNKPKVFENFKNNNRFIYNCSSPVYLKGRSLLHLDLSSNSCLLDMDMKILTLTLSILFIVFLVVGSGLYRFRWHIRYFIYMIRYNQRQEIVDTRSYDYDAFVAYSSDDRRWIINTLLPVVENHDGLKLCVHDRDFEVGNLIVDNIVDGIEKSRKVIIVLSNNFAKSDWCQFELNLIQRHVLENGQRLLVVVMLEDIKTCHMTKALKVMLQTTTYLLWGEEEYAQKAFFNRLRLMLRRNSQKKRLRRLSV